MAAITDAEILAKARERFKRSRTLAEMGCPQRAGEMAGFLADVCKDGGRPELAEALEFMVLLEVEQIQFHARQLKAAQRGETPI